MELTFLALGVAAGILSGMFGIGGGIIIVPALIILTRMPAVMATGTSLGALLLPVGALGAWVYYRNGNLQVDAALWIAVGLVAGAFVGAHVAHWLPEFYLKRLFAVFLAAAAVRIWWTA